MNREEETLEKIEAIEIRVHTHSHTNFRLLLEQPTPDRLKI